MKKFIQVIKVNLCLSNYEAILLYLGQIGRNDGEILLYQCLQGKNIGGGDLNSDTRLLSQAQDHF